MDWEPYRHSTTVYLATRLLETVAVYVNAGYTVARLHALLSRRYRTSLSCAASHNNGGELWTQGDHLHG